MNARWSFRFRRYRSHLREIGLLDCLSGLQSSSLHPKLVFPILLDALFHAAKGTRYTRSSVGVSWVVTVRLRAEGGDGAGAEGGDRFDRSVSTQQHG